MKAFPWKCGECRERAVYPNKVDSYTISMVHDGSTYRISVNDFEAMKCQNCGALSLDDPALCRLSNALRSAAGVLQPTEIQANREALGVTREALARSLQIPEAMLEGLETGEQIQRRSIDMILRTFFLAERFRRISGLPPYRIVREQILRGSGQEGDQPPEDVEPIPFLLRPLNEPMRSTLYQSIEPINGQSAVPVPPATGLVA